MSDCASICEILITLSLNSQGLGNKKMAAWGDAEKNEFFFGFTQRGLRNANHSGLSTYIWCRSTLGKTKAHNITSAWAY